VGAMLRCVPVLFGWVLTPSAEDAFE